MMFFGQSPFILEGRKVTLVERHRHNDGLMRSYNLMLENYYESKYAWRLTFSLDSFSCYLNSSAQRRLPDFTASTRLSDKFKMAYAADDATVTWFSKCQEQYSIEDVNRVVFLRIMTLLRSLGCCRSKTWQITSRIGACQAACLMSMFARAKYFARKWTKYVCPHGHADRHILGLPHLKLAQAMTCAMTPFLSARSQWLLSWPLSASMYTNFA